MKTQEELKTEIFDLIKEYTALEASKKKNFKPGQKIPYSSRVYDDKERINLVDSALDFWLTSGKYCEKFEEKLSQYLEIEHIALVNSGSSANLLAFMTLTSPLLKDRAIKPGDEVITVAAGFPTTVSPIVQYGAIPVFVDITIPSYNIDVKQLEAARSEKTKAVMIAHTLGNVFDLLEVKQFCDKYQLWLIEDNCDALGAEYDMGYGLQKTGTIGDLGTSSFYPAHHITMGEGGACYTNNPLLSKIMFSMRDWGRDCVCTGGKDDSCGHRFDGQYGELPKGYDHKYVYSHFGYNLKITEMQAAVGFAQLEKLPLFVEKRRNNWKRLKEGLKDLNDQIILPEEQEKSKNSPFGFVITLKENAQKTREEIIQFLEEKGIQTRMLFAGNIVKNPCFDEMRQKQEGYRIVSELANTDIIMNYTFWIGVYPGMTEEVIDYMIKILKEALR